MGMLVSIKILNMRTLKESSPGSEKSSSFPDNLREELDEKFSVTQNDCHHTELQPCVNCVTTIFRRLTRDVYENSCPSIERNIPIKSEYSK